MCVYIRMHAHANTCVCVCTHRGSEQRADLCVHQAFCNSFTDIQSSGLKGPLFITKDKE